jgi:hypothetical protein
MRLTVMGVVGVVREVFVSTNHVFVQKGRGDVGTLVRHDGRALAKLREEEIKELMQ